MPRENTCVTLSIVLQCLSVASRAKAQSNNKELTEVEPANPIHPKEKPARLSDLSLAGERQTAPHPAAARRSKVVNHISF